MDVFLSMSPFEVAVVLVFGVVGVPVAIGLIWITYDSWRHPDKYDDPH